MARFSRRPSPSLGGAFRKVLDLSLYAGVRLIPVTGRHWTAQILEGSILLKPASDAGLRLGAGRGSRTPKSRSSADFEGTGMIYAGIR
jgi:hypothetical protein